MELGLILAVFLLGLRHGADWDHIAALTDITASQEGSSRRGVWLGTMYAVGHAAVVFAFGIAVIALGARVPDTVEDLMGRIVGVTLVLLAIYVAWSLIRFGKDFRLASRWMLVIRGLRRAHRWFRGRGNVHQIHSHGHSKADGFHHKTQKRNHLSDEDELTHEHAHAHPEDDLSLSYGTGAALTIGGLHGVGAETPTQMLLLAAVAGVAGVTGGLTLLVAFLVGLFLTNTVITLGSAYGFLSAAKYPRVYVAFGIVTVVVSLVVGMLFILGSEIV